MQLTTSQRSFLAGVHFAVVSTISADGLPHQTVMWYMLEGDGLLLSTPRENLNEEPISARADYERLGKRYRRTFNPFIILGFMLRGAPARLKRRWSKETSPRSDTNRMQDLLSRERVSLRVQLEKVHSNSLT